MRFENNKSHFFPSGDFRVLYIYSIAVAHSLVCLFSFSFQLFGCFSAYIDFILAEANIAAAHSCVHMCVCVSVIVVPKSFFLLFFILTHFHCVFIRFSFSYGFYVLLSVFVILLMCINIFYVSFLFRAISWFFLVRIIAIIMMEKYLDYILSTRQKTSLKPMIHSLGYNSVGVRRRITDFLFILACVGLPQSVSLVCAFSVNLCVHFTIISGVHIYAFVRLFVCLFLFFLRFVPFLQHLLLFTLCPLSALFFVPD